MWVSCAWRQGVVWVAVWRPKIASCRGCVQGTEVQGTQDAGGLKAADRHAAAVCCCPQLPYQLAVVVGTESSGISSEMRDAADRWGARCSCQGRDSHAVLCCQGTLDSLLLPSLQRDCTVQFAPHAGRKQWDG